MSSWKVWLLQLVLQNVWVKRMTKERKQFVLVRMNYGWPSRTHSVSVRRAFRTIFEQIKVHPRKMHNPESCILKPSIMVCIYWGCTVPVLCRIQSCCVLPAQYNELNSSHQNLESFNMMLDQAHFDWCYRKYIWKHYNYVWNTYCMYYTVAKLELRIMKKTSYTERRISNEQYTRGHLESRLHIGASTPRVNTLSTPTC